MKRLAICDKMWQDAQDALEVTIFVRRAGGNDK